MASRQHSAARLILMASRHYTLLQGSFSWHPVNTLLQDSFSWHLFITLLQDSFSWHPVISLLQDLFSWPPRDLLRSDFTALHQIRSFVVAFLWRILSARLIDSLFVRWLHSFASDQVFCCCVPVTHLERKRSRSRFASNYSTSPWVAHVNTL